MELTHSSIYCMELTLQYVLHEIIVSHKNIKHELVNTLVHDVNRAIFSPAWILFDSLLKESQFNLLGQSF